MQLVDLSGMGNADAQRQCYGIGKSVRLFVLPTSINSDIRETIKYCSHINPDEFCNYTVVTT